MLPEFTFVDVAKHASRGDLYVILGDSVYDVSSFIEEHPGGEEILLELGGQDATEGYNEAGHTAKAHEILFELRVGKLKRVSGDPTPATLKVPSVSDNVANEGRDIAANGNRSRVSVLVAILLGGVLASAAYQYSRSKEVQP